MTEHRLQDETWLRARGGCTESQAALLEAAAPAVRAVIERELPARHRAVLATDDVMQQTCVDAFRDFHHFNGGGPDDLRAWLIVVARRNVIDAIRELDAEKRGGKRRRSQLSTEESRARLLERISGGTRPSLHAMRSEGVAALTAAIAALPDEYRICVETFDLQGQAMEQVADRLGRSRGACYMIRARAHRMLRSALGRSSHFL